MLGTWPLPELPNLNDQNCQVTSPVTPRYNCIAWAAEDDQRWWWPDPFFTSYWPPHPVPREVTMAAFEAAYSSLGYQRCNDGALEEGVQKIAIFGTRDYFGGIVPTHAARQLESGKWTSKLGTAEDISHSAPNDVAGPVYGQAVLFMGRPHQRNVDDCVN